MTETTYENLTRHIDRISAEMREIGEKKWAQQTFIIGKSDKIHQRKFIPFTLD